MGGARLTIDDQTAALWDNDLSAPGQVASAVAEGTVDLEAATMLISIEIERTQPLTGIASSVGKGPVSFVGWMALLRVIADLTETMDRSSDVGLNAEARSAPQPVVPGALP